LRVGAGEVEGVVGGGRSEEGVEGGERIFEERGRRRLVDRLVGTERVEGETDEVDVCFESQEKSALLSTRRCKGENAHSSPGQYGVYP
jgi:hypothetical protein